MFVLHRALLTLPLQTGRISPLFSDVVEITIRTAGGRTATYSWNSLTRASRGRSRTKIQSRKSMQDASQERSPTDQKNPVSFHIRDETAVLAFYNLILTLSQQHFCRYISKWWIKAINPLKQTLHPYAGGSERKPPWWPDTPKNKSKGATENGCVRHIEPDHLSKQGDNYM